jgi:tetratricopeptide (TPR) repeat protein
MCPMRPALVAALVSALTMVMGFSLCAQVRAESTDEVGVRVEALAQEAKSMVGASLYEEAIARYMQAYHLQPAGLLLYNVAFIYDKKLGDAALAVEFYRRYLRSYEPDVGMVRRTLSRLRELKGAAESLDGRRRAERALSGDPDGDWNIGWITVGSGGAVLTGGLAVGVLSLKTTQQFDATNDPVLRKGLAAKGGQQALAANILMGLGGAILATGVVLLLLDGDDQDEARAQERIFPLLSRSAGGFTLGVEGRW